MHVSIERVTISYPDEDAPPGTPSIVQLSVLMDGKKLIAQSLVSPEVSKSVPMEYLMGQLRRQIMSCIEQHLFNDFNNRGLLH
jgi:hypothetical protein